MSDVVDYDTTDDARHVFVADQVCRVLRRVAWVDGHQEGEQEYARRCRAGGYLALALASGELVVPTCLEPNEAEALPAALAEDVRAQLAELALQPGDAAAIADGYVAALAGAPLENDARRRNDRKRSGSYYTPAPLVARILELVLDPLLVACDSPEALLALRILDPACGSGHFLLAVHARLARRLAHLRGSLPEVAATEPRLLRCLVGYERDPFVARVCAARLRHALGVGHAAPGHTEDPVRVRLLDSLLEEHKDEPSQAFDAVVGNPPWVSYTGRQSAGADATWLARLVTRYPPIRAWKAAHSAFLLRSLELVRPGGRVGLVLPLQLRYHARYAAVREAVAQHCKEIYVEDAGERAFAAVEQATGLFAFARRTGTTQQASIPDGADPWPATRMRNGAAARATDEDAGSAAQLSSGQAADQRDADELLCESLDTLPRLPKELFSDSGVHTGNVARKVIRATDDPEVSARPEEFAPVREGRDIQPYFCGEPRKRLWLSPPLADGEYCRIGPAARYLGVPIVVRQTAARPIAARHTMPSYFRNSLLACWGTPELQPEVLLAVLNSELIAHLHRRAHGDATQRTFPQVKVGHLRALPKFKPTRLTASRQARLVQLVRDREACAATPEAVEVGTLDEAIEQEVATLYGVARLWSRVRQSG